jgi:hypothetical protein
MMREVIQGVPKAAAFEERALENFIPAIWVSQRAVGGECQRWIEIDLLQAQARQCPQNWRWPWQKAYTK